MEKILVLTGLLLSLVGCSGKNASKEVNGTQNSPTVRVVCPDGSRINTEDERSVRTRIVEAQRHVSIPEGKEHSSSQQQNSGKKGLTLEPDSRSAEKSLEVRRGRTIELDKSDKREIH